MSMHNIMSKETQYYGKEILSENIYVDYDYISQFIWLVAQHVDKKIDNTTIDCFDLIRTNTLIEENDNITFIDCTGKLKHRFIQGVRVGGKELSNLLIKGIKQGSIVVTNVDKYGKQKKLEVTVKIPNK